MAIRPKSAGGDGPAAPSPGQPFWSLVPAGVFLVVLPLNHTMALRLVSLFAALGVALWSARRYGMPEVRIKWPLIAWIALALLSLAWSENRSFSLGEIKSEIGYGMAAFFTFLILTRGEREWKLWLDLAVVSLGITLVLALSGYARRPDPDYYNWDPVHGYASYSTYLAIAAPLLILWLLRSRGSLRLAGFALLAAYLWVNYLVANRMFWVSLVCVLAAFAALVGWRLPGGRAKTRVMAALLAGIALSGAIFVLVASQKLVDYTAQSLAGSTREQVVGTFVQSERRYIWSYWVERIGERPWTGVGFGRDLPHWVYEKPAEWPDSYFAHAHNMVLDYGLQMGIPGIAVLLLLLGAITAGFWRMARAPEQWQWLAGAAGLGVMVAMFSKNMVDDLFWRTDALVFWSYAGMLLGLGARFAAPAKR